MTTARDIERLIDEIDNTPYGPDERRLVAEALAKAAEIDDLDLQYRLRLRQGNSAFMAGDTEGFLTAFTWCVTRHDADPERFPLVVDEHDLLWQCKWMAELLLVNPRFPLAQTEAAVADMERRYRQAGVGLSGVWQAKFSIALETGRLDDATRLRAERDAVPRDDYSHCDACVRAEDVVYLTELGDEAAALELFGEIMDEGYTCGEEPEHVQAYVLPLLLRAGRFDEAVYHHRRALRMARLAPDPLGLVLPHLRFLVMTGNLNKALDLTEEYVPLWAGERLHARVLFDGACAFGLVASGLTAAGHGEVPIRGSNDPALESLFGVAEGLRTAQEFAEACWGLADSLAEQFDTRNGTDAFARRVARERACLEEHYDLPLGGPVPLDVDIAMPTLKTAGEYLASVRLRMREFVNLDAALADARAGMAVASGLEKAELAFEAFRIAQRLEHPDAADALEAAVAALREMGRTGEAEIWARHGAALATDEPVDLGAYADDPDVRVRSLVAWRRLLDALREDLIEQAIPLFAEVQSLEHPDLVYRIADCKLIEMDALSDLEPEQSAALAEELTQHPDPLASYMGSVRMAQRLGAAGEPERGLAPAERALTIAASAGLRTLTMHAAALSAQLLWDAGRFDEAINRQRVAVRQAQLSESDFVIGHRFRLGDWLLGVGRTTEASDEFTAVAALEEAAGAPPEALAHTHLYQGFAARDHDLGGAYQAFMRATAAAADGEDVELRVRIALSLGQFLFSMEDEDCVDVFAGAVAEAREGVPDAMAVVLHWSGRARCQFGDAEGLDELDAALAIEREAANAWAVADITDSRGRALAALGRVDEGVSTLLGAADLYADAEDIAMAAGAEVAAARILREAERNDDAVSAYAAAKDRVAGDPQLRLGVVAEFADFLEEIGDPGRAAALRAELGPEV